MCSITSQLLRGGQPLKAESTVGAGTVLDDLEFILLENELDGVEQKIEVDLNSEPVAERKLMVYRTSWGANSGNNRKLSTKVAPIEVCS